MSVRQIHYNNDEGVCQYRDCRRPVSDGISIQLCDKHLQLACAAFVLTNLTDLTPLATTAEVR